MADNKENKAMTPEQWAAIHRSDVNTEVNSLMRGAYLQYSVSANIGRAIPDVRDGLKPGARRILYAMLRGGYTYAAGLSKCAKVVGLVIGNYHPHGDTAVYDTIVRMGQDFTMRTRLIFPKGNFGTMDGDEAAAYRYTECKMEKAAEALLADLDKETVDMRETFDGKELEPIVLPAAFPNLLVNGSQGIGVGMATYVPTHNMGEAIDAVVAVIDNPEITLEELMEVLPGPDFPTGGIIHGLKGVRQLYATGQGGVRVRGKTEMVTEPNGRTKIIISEIPYGVNKADMVGKIGELAQAGTIHGVSNIVDLSSDRVGVRVEISLKQDALPNVVLNEIFRNTPLEVTLPAQFLVVDHNRPRTMTLKQILDAYIDHREQVVTRRTKYLLRKALERDHIVEGLLIAQANIDEVIHIIRNAKDRGTAQQGLMARFGLDDLQANAILDMRLASLTNLAVEDLTKEHNDLQAEITEYNRILSARANIMAIVRQELLETKAKFATPRKTLIEPTEGEADLDGLTKREMYVVTLSRQGYIKRCNTEEYKTQNRGGSGVYGMKAKKEGDTVQIVLSTRSHNTLLFFTNYGRVYRLRRAYELPDAGRGDSGRFIQNVLSLMHDDAKPEANEEIRAIVSYDEKDPDVASKFIVMVTRNGIVKRMSLELFSHVPKAGKRAMNFKEDSDDLIEAQVTSGDDDLIISSANGRAVRFGENILRPMGTVAAGVRGIKLKAAADGSADRVVSLTVANPADELLIVTAGGLGKRTPVGFGGAAPANEVPADEDSDVSNDADEASAAAEPEEAEEPEEVVDENAPATEVHEIRDHYRRTNRGTQGVISIKLVPGDQVVAAMQIEPDSTLDLLMLSKHGQAVRIPVDQVRRTGRNCKGVKMMAFSKKNDAIANVSLVEPLPDEDAAFNEARAESDERAAQHAADFAAKRAAEDAAQAAAEEAAESAVQETLENGEAVAGDAPAGNEDNQ